MIEEFIVLKVGEVSSLTPYPTRMEDDPELPGVTYQRITTNRDYTHNGHSGRTKALFQLNVWDTDYLSVRDRANQIINGLNGFKGTQHGVKIHSLLVENDHETIEFATDRYRRIIELAIDYKEV